jgi:hypothetical protein
MEVQIKATDKTQKGVKSASKSFAGLAKNIVAVSAALGAAAIAKSTQLFIRQEQAVKQLEIRLKSTGGVAGFTAKQLTEMAASLQKVSVFGDEAIIEMQSLLLTFTRIRGEEFKGAQEAILNVATAMGTDLKSAAIQVGKALNDPKIGLTALTRSGITFSETQKELIKGFVDGGEAAKAQQIILKELETQFGGAAQATGLGGAVKQFSNSFGDVLEAFGKGTSEGSNLESTLESLTDYMSDPSTLSAMKNFGEGIGEVARFITGAEEATKGLSTALFEIEEFDPEAALDPLGRSQAALALLIRSGQLAGPGGLGGVAAPIGGQEDLISTPLRLIQGAIGQAITGGDVGAFEAPGGMAAFRGAAAGVEGLTESLSTEVETIRASYDERMEIIRTAEEQGIDTADLAFRARVDFEEQLTRITERETEARRRKTEASLRSVQSFANNVFSAMAGFAEEGSRKEFEANKAGSIANAVINTAQGATKAFSQWGWPWGAVAAAAVIAAGGAQISRIEGQQYGGGSGAEAVPVATPDFIGQDQPITQPPTTTGAEAGGVSYTINNYGTVVDRSLDEFSRELIQPLETARLDGVRANT